MATASPQHGWPVAPASCGAPGTDVPEPLALGLLPWGRPDAALGEQSPEPGGSKDRASTEGVLAALPCALSSGTLPALHLRPPPSRRPLRHRDFRLCRHLLIPGLGRIPGPSRPRKSYGDSPSRTPHPGFGSRVLQQQEPVWAPPRPRFWGPPVVPGPSPACGHSLPPQATQQGREDLPVPLTLRHPQGLRLHAAPVTPAPHPWAPAKSRPPGASVRGGPGRARGVSASSTLKRRGSLLPET